MTNASETLDDEYEEYDEFDEEEEERGLSGFSVLVIGLVMIGAFVSVVWIAYQQGIRTGADGFGGKTPYIVADPEPIKIENTDASEPVADREVYDVFDGDNQDPVTVLAQGPEEPVARDAEDPIGSIAADAEDAAAAVSDEVEDRLASLQQEDAATLSLQSDAAEPAPDAATPPTAASVTTPSIKAAAPAGARSGTHVVQVGAFRSAQEAQAQWSRIKSRLGDFVSGKSDDIERADLGDRGVYHRLRIGPFKSSDEASAFCAGLKERGQDCLIKKL
jgi:cell division septation protein DedD